MQIILSVVVGLLLVLGQSLWKLSIKLSGVTATSTDKSELVRAGLSLILHPVFILGCIIYVVATVLYIYGISKYNYGVTYAMIVGCSAIFATIVSASFFGEKMYPINFAGIIVIIIGIALVIKK
jgi:multidrug transporter EmrE-like cation transporter